MQKEGPGAGWGLPRACSPDVWESTDPWVHRREVELYTRRAARTAAQRRHRPPGVLQRAALSGGVGRGGAGRRPGCLLWLYGPRMPSALLSAPGKDLPRRPEAPGGPQSLAG